MKIGEAVNLHGVPTSIHVCDSCGSQFTVCPAAGDDWGGCMSEKCSSYDEDRDADKLFDNNDPRIQRDDDPAEITDNIIDIEANLPHRVLEVICVHCMHRWIAVAPVEALLKDYECHNCRKIAGVISTGQEMPNE